MPLRPFHVLTHEHVGFQFWIPQPDGDIFTDGLPRGAHTKTKERISIHRLRYLRASYSHMGWYTAQMGTETDKLMMLAKGVRAISPGLKIEIANSESNPEQFCIAVSASSVIIVFTGYGTMESVLALAVSKLASISQRTLEAVKPE